MINVVLKECYCCKKVKAGTEIDGRWVCLDCTHIFYD